MFEDEARHLERKGSTHAEVDKGKNGIVYATTRLTTQIGGTTGSTTEVGDATRNFPMLDTEQEGS